MRKRVMILGAGREQVPIIKTCQEAGGEIILVSPEGSYPGFKYADRYYHVDVKDKEAVLKAAKAERIDAVLSDQLDAAVLTTAYVAEQLDLPGIGYEVATKFTNKLVMRQEAETLGIKVPRYHGAGNIEEANEAARSIGYPVVIKPVDSAASRGVFRINDDHQLREHFAESLAFSRIKKIIIEQMLKGREYVVQSFSYNDEVTNLIIGHREFFELPNLFIPRAALYVDAGSASSKAELDILAAHARLVRGLGLKLGIAYGEYLHNEETGEVYLVEIAARGAATFTSSDLIPLACGFNANQRLAEAAMGLKHSPEPIYCRQGAAAYFCFLLPPGRVISIENVEKVDILAGVHRVCLDTVSVGMQVPVPRDKGARKGPILVYGLSKQDCRDVIEKVKAKLKIEVETAIGEIKGIEW